MQLVRECKEVLKGGLLMKQYYQFMLHEVLLDRDKADCNIDAFQEDLHKMLMVGPCCSRLPLTLSRADGHSPSVGRATHWFWFHLLTPQAFQRDPVMPP